MKISKTEVLAFVIVLASFAVGYYYYPMLPEQVASHWNARGQVDGYMPRFWGAFLMPFISLVCLLIFMAIPRIDPKRENIKKFRGYFDAFIVTIFAFFLYIYGLTIAWNLGAQFELIQYMMPAFAVLLWMAGVLVGKAEPNWTIGIRTPWTLSSEIVWKKTHTLTAKLFKVAGLLALVGMFFPNDAMWFLLIPLILAVFVPFVYSYLLYRKEARV